MKKCAKCKSRELKSKTLCSNCLGKLKIRNKKMRAERAAKGLCSKCGQHEKFDKSCYCEKCKQYHQNKAKEIYNKHVDNNVCPICRGERDSEKKHCSKCLNKITLERQEIKDKVYNHYGGYKCKCCGETEKSFLSIDHINNDGAFYRKLVRSGGNFLNWIIKNNFPGDLQILCMNCQWGKRKNNGICPHKTKP